MYSTNTNDSFLNDFSSSFLNDLLSSPLPFLDEFIISPSTFPGDLVMPEYLGTLDLTTTNDLFYDTNQSNALADNPPTNLSNNAQGFNQVQLPWSDIDLSDLITSLALLPSDSSPDNDSPPPSSAEENDSHESLTFKSSDEKNTKNFIDGNGYFQTDASLRLTIPPLDYQRVRYEKELKNEALRYIAVFNNAVLTLMISNLLNDKMSFYLRITRLTKPYGPDNIQLYHPYQVWLNDEDALVHNNSLLMPISGQTIEVKKLVLPRPRQNKLRAIRQYPIFTPNQLDLNDVHPINTKKAQDMIEEYQLRYSILHFQVVFVDENNRIYPTDLQCQTEPMYEYEGNELNALPPYVRQTGKQSEKRKSTKRLQKSSTKKINKKRMPKKPPLPEGPPPPGV